MVAVPFLRPAVDVFMDTERSVLLVSPAWRLRNDPPAISPGEVVAIDPFRPSAGPAATLEIDRNWTGAVAPTRTLPRVTGLGVAGLAAARLPTTTCSFTMPTIEADWEASEVRPRWLVVAPS